MKIVVLDGRREGDGCLVFDVLLSELKDRGDEVEVFRLCEARMGTCIGCFGCWLKTPGICVEADEGRRFAEAVVQSDATILLSPVTFGGYSSEIKKAQDRWLPLLLPDFGVFHREVHHMPRYVRYPRLVGIGIQEKRDDEEADLFRALVGRNALNFHAPSFAAGVVVASDGEASLREGVRGILEREDPFPLREEMVSLMPEAVEVAESIPLRDGGESVRRALLIVGSPKVGASTSGALGGYVLGKLEEAGWETKAVTLRRSLLHDHGQVELAAEVEDADLILLAFPLYIDSLPFLLMKALEVLAELVDFRSGESAKRMAAIVNNGFPESYQNAVAVSICRRFAGEVGMVCSGGLAMGAGEALFEGQPVDEPSRNGIPVEHVRSALDLASTALAEGQPIPAEAIRLIHKVPIPMTPYRLWRWMFIKRANAHWRRRAAENDVGAEAMQAQPY